MGIFSLVLLSVNEMEVISHSIELSGASIHSMPFTGRPPPQALRLGWAYVEPQLVCVCVINQVVLGISIGVPSAEFVFTWCLILMVFVIAKSSLSSRFFFPFLVVFVIA